MTGKVRWIFNYLICFCFIKYKIIDIINKMYYTAYIDKDLQSNFGACLKFCASVEFDEKYQISFLCEGINSIEFQDFRLGLPLDKMIQF